MILGIDIEVFLALCYGAFLMGVAFLLEVLARRSQARAQAYHNSGFIYFRDLDYWQCPAGHQLVQIATNHEPKATLYRAPASACNACSLKLNCTDSNEGRLLEMRLDIWIESELRRFHRGISLALLLLASILLLAETFRYPQPYNRVALASLFLLLALAQLKLWPALRRRREV